MWDAIQEFKRQSICTIYTERKNNWKYRYEITNSNNYKILSISNVWYQLYEIILICVTENTKQWWNLPNILKTLIFQELCFENSKTVVLVFQHSRPGQVNRYNWRMTNAALLPFYVLCIFYIHCSVTKSRQQ